MTPIHAALQGLTAAERRLEWSTDRLTRAPRLAASGNDSVSLRDGAVELLAVRNAYEMNLQVLKVSEEIITKLVDFLA
jgi:hypothetical protein